MTNVPEFLMIILIRVMSFYEFDVLMDFFSMIFVRDVMTEVPQFSRKGD